jgi:N6-L-threonylcarbamoyladenine synthase
MGGDPARIPLPRPLRDRADCDMSFSGLKTALLRARDLHMTPEQTLTKQNQADIAAAFQLAVADILTQKSRVAMARYLTLAPQQPTFAVAGGVAANRMIRADLSALAASCKVGFVAPPLALCTDNAAMIAYVGLLRFLANDINPADLVARPRWPLDGQSPAMLGSGKKGAKA